MQIGKIPRKIHFTDRKKEKSHGSYIFNIFRYLQNFLVSSHAVVCSLPFLYLRFALALFVSLNVLKEFICYVVRMLNLKFVRFS